MGRCLVASTEVLRKLPQQERLVHNYNCVAVEDVNDVERLAAQLSAIAGNHEEEQPPSPRAVSVRS